MTDEDQFRRVHWDGDEPLESDEDGPDGMPLPPARDRSISAEDLELLTLAARAIGAVRIEEVDGEGYTNVHLKDGAVEYAWNPLVHSDDALRLSVTLEIDVVHRVVGGRRVEAIPAGLPAFAEPYQGNPLVATKRAIVRAAAEIGKQRS